MLLGRETTRVEANRDEPFDLAPVNCLHKFICGEPFSRQFFFVDAPDLADVTPVLGIFDVTVAGKLIALMTMLAPALAVALAGDRGVAAIRLANAAGREHEIDAGNHVLDSLGMVLDAARVQQEAGLRPAPPLGGTHDFFFRNASDPLSPVQVVILRPPPRFRRSRSCSCR